MLFFFFLPFERIPTLEIFGFTLKISYILGLAILVLFLFSNPRKYLNKTSISVSDWFLIVFFVLSTISTLIYSVQSRSIIILLIWGFVFLLYLTLTKVIRDRETIKTIENSILIATVAICFFGLFQFIADSLGFSQAVTGLRYEYTKTIMAFPRVQSVSLEPLYFANFLLFPLFIAIKRYLFAEGRFGGYFWLISLILALITLTISRGAFLAATICLLILSAYLVVQKQKALRQKAGMIMLSLAIAVLFAFGLIYLFNGPKALDMFFGHTVVENVEEDGSSYNRILTYQQSFSIFSESILLGKGVGSFGILTTPFEDIAKKGYATVNNEYLEILSETGILGFAIFLFFIFYYFKEIYDASRQANRETRAGLFVLALAALAVLIQYNFFSTLYIIYIWAFLAYAKAETYQLEEK